MSVIVNKRAFPDSPRDEGRTKRIKCPTSPILLQRPPGFSDKLEYLQRMFPSTHVGIITTFLESCNYSIESATESLQRFAPPVEEPEIDAMDCGDRGRKRPLTEVSNASDPFVMSANSHPHDEWAERVVRALHGCPSVDAAKVRTREALVAFEEEILRSVSSGSSDEDLARIQSLQQANRVLFKAMHIMNDKNRDLKARADDSDQLREQLVQCQEQLRKTEQINKTLQWHLSQQRASFDAPSFGPPSVF